MPVGWWRPAIVGGLLLALGIGLVGIGQAQIPEDVLVFASVDSVTTWDPSASYSTELTYLANIYEPLVWVNRPGEEPEFIPALAERWERSPDGLTWRFYLRQGVIFHDGEPFTAYAVKASLERTIRLGAGAAFIFAPIQEIVVVDDYTVEFRLKYPGPLLRILSSAYGAWIMSPRAAEQPSEWFNQGNAAGTGPYRLVRWKPDEELVLERFDGYWQGWEGKHLSRVLIRIVKDATVMRQMLESGQADLVSRVPIEAVPDIQEQPGLEVLRGPSFLNYAIHINTRKPPLDNRLVRQAISYAIPYQDIIDVGAGGWGRQAIGPLPRGLFGHSDELFQYTYDLERARELLAEAGFPDGLDRTLLFTYTAENDVEARFAPLVKESLAQIGIDVEIRPMLWTAQWQYAKGDPTQAQDLFALLWWPTFNDAYETLYSLWHCEDPPFFNLSYYCNPDFDATINQAYTASGLDPRQAEQLYKQAQEMLIEDAPSVFLFDVDIAVPKRECLRNYRINPSYPRVPFFYEMYKEGC